MSDVKRYDPINSDGTCGMCIEDADYGAYVEYADYAAAQRAIAELDRKVWEWSSAATAEAHRVDELKAERDTLRQALAERDAQIASMRAEVTPFIETHWRPVERQRDLLAGLLREKFPRIDPENPYPLDEVEHHCEYTLYQERERLHREIDAALAEVTSKK